MERKKPKKDNIAKNEEDDLLHVPDNTLKWRESYYFNWIDLENHISGFSTIGLVPNEKKREFVFFLFTDDKRESYYREPPLKEYNNKVDLMLRDKKLSYNLVTPLKTWDIIFKSHKFEFNIRFEARFPIHNFGVGSSSSWHQHFEASGTVKGQIKYKDGKIIEIDGYGQRDKSWGYRDWHEFEKWYAGHFQFKEWTCGFRKDYIKDVVDLSGYIADSKGNYQLSQLDIDTVYDKDNYCSPLTTIYKIVDERGKEYNIQANLLQKHSYIRFTRDFPGGYTELFEQMVSMRDLKSDELGSGMAEQLRTVNTNV